MMIGKVVGNVWATKKNENLRGQKLLIVRVMDSAKNARQGMMVACDSVGAGIGDTILLCHGYAAREASGNPDAPVDLAIVGIVDELEVHVDESE